MEVSWYLNHVIENYYLSIAILTPRNSIHDCNWIVVPWNRNGVLSSNLPSRYTFTGNTWLLKQQLEIFPLLMKKFICITEMGKQTY